MGFDISKIKLIVGLGNVGEEYENTRHNAGFIFIDKLSDSTFKLESKFQAEISEVKIKNTKVLLVKPVTLMNLSGQSVSLVKNFYKVKGEEIILAYDDLDISLGEYKIQFDKYPRIHNGVNSVIRSLGGEKFWSLRIGIDSRNEIQKNNMSGSDYVLGRFKVQEKEELEDTIQQILENIK